MATIAELFKAGHVRVRKPVWGHADDYVLLDVLLTYGRRYFGPWGHLYSPVQLVIPDWDGGRPQTIPVVLDTDTDWEPFMGTPAADERAYDESKEKS